MQLKKIRADRSAAHEVLGVIMMTVIALILAVAVYAWLTSAFVALGKGQPNYVGCTAASDSEGNSIVQINYVKERLPIQAVRFQYMARNGTVKSAGTLDQIYYTNTTSDGTNLHVIYYDGDQNALLDASDTIKIEKAILEPGGKLILSSTVSGGILAEVSA